MKIFISWSGQRGKAVAEVLRDWLPNVIQSVKPWVSSEDIYVGSRWAKEIAEMLNEMNFGILCLTPENWKAPWILFEAGALSKSIPESRVCPYYYDIEPSQIEGPLTQFQGTTTDREGTRKLILTINEVAGIERLSEEKLFKYFEKWWPDLEQALASIPSPAFPKISKRPVEDMIEELLSLARNTSRELAKLSETQRKAEGGENSQAVLEELKRSISEMVNTWKISLPNRGEEIWRWQSRDGLLRAHAFVDNNADLTIRFSSEDLTLEGVILHVRFGQFSQEIQLKRISESEISAEVRVPWQYRTRNMADISIEIV